MLGTTAFSQSTLVASGRLCDGVVVKGLFLLCAIIWYLGASGRNVMAEEGHYAGTIEDIYAFTAKSAGQETAVNPVVFQGSVSYDLRLASHTARMTASRIHNTSNYNTTGKLRLELWLLGSPYQGGGGTGYPMAKYQFPGSGRLLPGQSYTNVDVTVPLLMAQVPAGTYYPHLFIMEYSSTCGVNEGYCSDGWATFNPIQIGYGGGGFAIQPGISGTWVDAAARGEAGLAFEVLANHQFVITWYSYASGGGMAYFGGVGPYQGNVVNAELFLKEGAGARFPPRYAPGSTYTTLWGSVEIEFFDCNHARLSWWPVLPGYSSGSVNLIRLTSIAGLSCQ